MPSSFHDHVLFIPRGRRHLIHTSFTRDHHHRFHQVSEGMAEDLRSRIDWRWLEEALRVSQCEGRWGGRDGDELMGDDGSFTNDDGGLVRGALPARHDDGAFLSAMVDGDEVMMAS